MKTKENIKIYKRGISLIVLVITVIVIIILAASIVLSIKSSEIISRVHKAKKDTDYQSAKEVVVVAQADWNLMTDSEKEANGPTFLEYAESRLVKAGFKTSGNGGYKLSEVGNINRIYIGKDNKQAIIPEGFVVSKVTGETTVTEGLVIYEGNIEVTDANVAMALTTRNQYVWIPVDDMDEFIRFAGYYNGTLQPFSATNHTEPFSNGTLSANNDLTGEYAEYDKMYNSVANYGGFYIARYEAGSETERTDISK